MPDYGSTELAELQLYLAWRAEGLPVESPGVRR
jgi:sulfur-oxidizing protein SoxA